MKHPTLIVVCGHPLAGKSTVARLLQQKLAEKGEKVHWIDIDDARRVMIGLPYPYPDKSPTHMAFDQQEMGGAYRFVNDAADWHLSQGRSLIVTYTLSRQVGQQRLVEMVDKYPKARLRVIWCCADSMSEAEVMRRLDRGFGDGGYVGGVNSYARYLEVKERFQPIVLHHKRLTTCLPETPESSAEWALKYVLDLE